MPTAAHSKVWKILAVWNFPLCTCGSAHQVLFLLSPCVFSAPQYTLHCTAAVCCLAVGQKLAVRKYWVPIRPADKLVFSLDTTFATHTHRYVLSLSKSHILNTATILFSESLHIRVFSKCPSSQIISGPCSNGASVAPASLTRVSAKFFLITVGNCKERISNILQFQNFHVFLENL